MSRVLGSIDGAEVGKIIVAIMKERIGEVGEVIAVDGKAIRSTAKTNQPHSALQIITAYLTESGVVLGQEKVNEKTNEIPAFQQMLLYLNLEGKTITADAMHCQKETCAKIIAKQGDYVFGLTFYMIFDYLLKSSHLPIKPYFTGFVGILSCGRNSHIPS